MQVPPLDSAGRVINALEVAGLTPAIGGSGLLVALGLAEVARDWDVTIDASEAQVIAALRRDGLTFHDATVRERPFATARRLVVSSNGSDVDLLVRFALFGPVGREDFPTRVTDRWQGLPIGDPRVWERAYRLLNNPAKAEVLHRWLMTHEHPETAPGTARATGIASVIGSPDYPKR